MKLEIQKTKDDWVLSVVPHVWGDYYIFPHLSRRFQNIHQAHGGGGGVEEERVNNLKIYSQ